MLIDGKYYLIDIESGESYLVTKEVHDSYIQMWESLKPKLSNENNDKLGTLICYGTGGEQKPSYIDFQKLWDKTK